MVYKNVIGARKTSWQIFSSVEENMGYEQNAKRIKSYRKRVEDELTEIWCVFVLFYGNGKGIFYPKML